MIIGGGRRNEGVEGGVCVRFDCDCRPPRASVRSVRPCGWVGWLWVGGQACVDGICFLSSES